MPKKGMHRVYRFVVIAFVSFLFAVSINAATFVVTNTNDSGAGSLRQALIDAGTNNQEDTVNFDPTVFSSPRTITLTTGELVVGADNSSGTPKTLTINGPGANLLTINGNDQNRVLRFRRDSWSIVNGLRITGGNALLTQSSTNHGGGILVEGISLGTAVNFVLTNSIIEGNKAPYISGSGSGGGISLSGNVRIINCTIANNGSPAYGGGLSMGPNSSVKLINSTVSGNTATLGGGIYNDAGNLYMTNSTVAFNTSPTGGGGGVHSSGFGVQQPTFYAKNSIIAKNIAAGLGFDINGTLYSQGYNIIGDTLGASIVLDTTGNQLNVDPQLDVALSPNGGVIPTHAFRANSPAIDRGDNCVLNTTANGGCFDFSVTADARGVLRPQDGDANGTATVDIGAFEITPQEVALGMTTAPDLQAVSDTGYLTNDNLTSDTTPSFDVTGFTANATVELLRNGVVVASTAATGTSVVMTDPAAPANATHFYTVRQIVNNVVGLQSPGLPITVDTGSPTVVVNQAAGQSDPTRTQPINFTVVFSEQILGFYPEDISLAGSTAGVSSATINISGYGTTFNVEISGISGDGEVRPSILANSVDDFAGNLNVASSSTDTVTFDTAAPTVTIDQAAAQTDPTRISPINFTVVFNEPVTGFTGADVVLSGSVPNIGSATKTVTGSGSTYNVAVSGFSSNGGSITASIPAQTANDLAGNANLASTSTDNTITVDNVAPTVTINQAAGQSDPTNALPVNYTVVFSEPVTGFDSALDVSFTGSTVNTLPAVVTITGSGATYNVAVSGINSNGGTLRLQVPNSAAQDALGNVNFASTSTDNAVRIDNVAPSVSINQASAQQDPTSTQPVNFTVTFNELIIGFTAADVSLSGSTANVSFAVINVTGSGNVYTVSVSNVRSTGQVRASIIAGAATDAAGNQNTASISTDNTVTVNVPTRAPFDFDGDHKTDVGIWRASTGSWWYLQSSDLSGHGFSFGLADDIITPGDYTGDGKTDLAIWRPSTGEWYVQRSEDGSYFSYQFGLPGDIPAPADYDGDGITDTATFRPSTATWYIYNSATGTYSIVTFGLDGDKPVVADYDGDGKADIAVWRASTGSWWYLRSSDLQGRGFSFGLSTDKPVPGDYTGDGKADIAVWRDATREWFFLRSEDASYYSYPSGLPGDIPAPGDYDGDGKFDSGVFRPSTQTWYIDGSTAGSMILTFGLDGDRPVPNAFVP